MGRSANFSFASKATAQTGSLLFHFSAAETLITVSPALAPAARTVSVPGTAWMLTGGIGRSFAVSGMNPTLKDLGGVPRKRNSPEITYFFAGSTAKTFLELTQTRAPERRKTPSFSSTFFGG